MDWHEAIRAVISSIRRLSASRVASLAWLICLMALLVIAGSSAFALLSPDPAQNVITTVAGTGLAGPGDNGPATIAGLLYPYDIAVDETGNIFIGQDARVRKITTDGVINTIAGTGVSGFSGDGGPATAAQISGVRGITVDPGNVLIVDGGNQYSQNHWEGIITTVAGTG